MSKKKEKLYTIHPQIIFVLAGSYNQFIDFVRPHQAEGLTFVYADRPNSIAGYKPNRVITIGTFWDRFDAFKMVDYIKMHHMIDITPIKI